MKMLKKAGAIAIAGAMVMSLGTISAFAEGEATTADPIVIDKEITINPVLNEAGEKTGVLEVTVPYTVNASGVDQVTLLAEFGDSEAFTNKIDYTTTAYIDQKADDSKAFTFKINENRLIPEGTTKNVYLNVKIGGNGVAKAAEGHKEAYKYVEPEVPTTPITHAMISGAVDADFADAYGTTGAVVSRLDITDLVANTKIDLTKQTIKIGGVEAKYTLYNGVYKVIYAGALTADTTVEVVDSENGMARLYYADTDGDATVKLGDVGTVVNIALLKYTPSSIYEYLVADTDADNSVKLGDVGSIVNIALQKATSCTAMEK